MVDYIFLIGGLIALLVGGDILVRGSVGLAEKLNIPPLIIGLTVVSFGTSAPELFISVKAAINGAGGIAVGNVVGSNITNVMLVLGLPAVLQAIVCDEKGISKNLAIMLGVTIVFMAFLAKGSLSRLDGFVLVGLLALFLYDQLRAARNARADAVKTTDYHDELENIPTKGWVIGTLIAVGIIILPVAAGVTVDAATTIAKSWQVSDEVIGLTILAIGTSLPELATTLMAITRNNNSVALGNIVGSNIFNILAIMGVTVIIQPIEVGGHIVNFDMWVMLATALLLAFLAHYKHTVGKFRGLAMTTAYCGYVYAAFVI